MRRGDVAVLSISSALAAIVVAAVTYSVLVLDRQPTSSAWGSGTSDSSWLVVTWGPSLCRIEPSNSGCRSGHVGAMGDTWILHGLWPQPADNQYCGVPKEVADRARDVRAGDMPPVQLQPDVRDRLAALVSDASVMAPHEWYAHGTCSGVTPDVFFDDAVTLTQQARQVLDPLFRDSSGTRISVATVRDRFDDTFGPGAGERVGLSCRKATGLGSVYYEVHLSLPPVAQLRTVGDALSLRDLLPDGPPIDGGCGHGHVL